jgi:hypothetical protein
MVMLLRDFGGVWDNIYDRMFTTLRFPVILDGQFTSLFVDRM